MTQLQFIEKYLLGKGRRSTYTDRWEVTPDAREYGGTLFLQYLDEIKLLKDATDIDNFHRALRTKLGKFRADNSIEDGGRETRANAPFFDDPTEPTFKPRSSLPAFFQEQFKVIQESLLEFRQSNSEKFTPPGNVMTALKVLMQPYQKTMSNLIGGVHNCTEETMFQAISKLNFDPLTTVHLELGSGAPLFGLESSIFTKKTICLDLPAVMKTVFWILSFLSTDDKLFSQTIHMVSGLNFSELF